MPSYAKFMKDILSNKRKLEDNETIMFTEEGSAILQHKLPLKLKDPESFTIPCNIGNLYIDEALYDLRASINLMHLSLFRKLGLGEAKSTTVSLQLADRSIKHPRGICEDILVKVDKFIFPADFIILDMEEDRDVPLILGRPFLATGRIMIDIDVIKEAVSETFKLDHPQDLLELCLVHSQDLPSEKEEAEECKSYLVAIPPFFKQPRLELGERPTTPLPSIEQAPVLELKQLLTHLRYAYLGEKNSLPVIISNNLTEVEEDRLLRVLRKHETAIGWTISDIKGISPSLCMHKILMEDDYKASIEHQCRLNPTMQEVVRKEVLKLLDAEIIYPISDSHCVNLVQEKLVSTPVLAPPDWDYPFELMCDASDHVVGAVLGQRKGKISHVIHYASKTLDKAQMNYATTEKELLAVVFAVDEFRSYLIGSKVIVYTDHSALKYLMSQKDAKPRLIRWILLLQEFDLEIRDKKKSENVVADHLSRLESHESNPTLEINEAFHDEMLFQIITTPCYTDYVYYLARSIIPPDYSSHQKKKFFSDLKHYFWDDPILYRRGPDQIIRRCVPEVEQHQVLESCHSAPYGGHFAATKTVAKVLQLGFYWPTLFKDAHYMVKHCDKCQRTGYISRRN
ncbi:uncharacterized protein LOC111409540 [Olea europaea var. sylvestris]|uniref:uncharacterized protein LOC111409540 n=1 Tax=Olea europaea var. sylvestris TaxID=158386 RepID=UPI000C1D5054|nr:uncharacterized protein LOC111409540 [Olea europaea var. sylvestris]